MKILNKFLYNLRKYLFRNYRENAIIKTLKKEIILISESKQKKQNFKILDFGSGMQPYVIENLIKELNLNNKKKYTADCYDFYERNILNKININKNINFFHINDLIKNNKYDFILIIDVLHHIGVNNTNQIKSLLTKLSFMGEYIIIKDHFEKNYISRSLLILMDFIGNYYNGVKIPKIYFKENNFKKLIYELKLFEVKRITNIYYYTKIWLFFNNPNLHFISILKLNNENK